MASRCLNDFKHAFYKCHFDDLFALFSSSYHAGKFKEYLSFQHIYMNVFIEKEKDRC